MQRSIHWNAFRDIFIGWWRDVSGISLIYVTVALPALMGCCLLAIDVGRLLSLQSSLQNAADSIALAAAGELDRAPDAITRADRAIVSLIGNPTVFATDVAKIDGSKVAARYLKSLPASDALPIGAANFTADPVEARYVEIRVTPVTFTTLFPATFIGAATNTARLSATAVAGFDAVVCDFTPMFMCNPYEPSNATPLDAAEIYDHVATMNNRRKLIEFKRGKYGYLKIPLEPEGGTLEDALGKAIASVKSRACFSQNGVYTAGRAKVSKDAFNVRFDIYKGKYKRADYLPAVNVRKGYTYGAISGPCSAEPDPLHIARGFPRDSCLKSGTCSVGDGHWDSEFGLYWGVNFGYSGKPMPPGYSNSNPPSRYHAYRYEIDHDLVKHPSLGGEKGAPACYNGSTEPSDMPDRRIIYGAIVNCKALPGIGSEDSSGPYAVAAFGKFFMTEPMGSDESLWVELVDVVQPGNSPDITRDAVQLYR